MKRIPGIALATLLILVLLELALYGLWLNHLARGEVAFDRGLYEEASRHFERARDGWELDLLPDFLSRENRDRAALNRLQIEFELGEYGRALEWLRTEPELRERASSHFWTGNLLVAQALEMMDRSLIESLNRARESYLQALERDPEHWDASYNYEYVSAILAGLESGESHAEEEVQILLEKMRTDIQRNRRELPPEERK